MPDVDAADRELVAAAAREAGAVAMRYFRADPRLWTKDDSSPVTEADIEVDRILRAGLLRARPSYGWLSEEQDDDGSRHGAERVFIVDPIDGTRAFVAGEEDWVVSIAVVEAGRPVAAALYRPPTDTLWVGAEGQGASRDGLQMAVTEHAGLPGARLVASRTAAAGAGLGSYEGQVRRWTSRSLAYRLALVAEGKADIALATAAAHDWDLAAAVLLVQEAGGMVTDLVGRPVRFNRRGIRHPALVAAGRTLHAAVVDAANGDRRANETESTK